MWVQWGLAGETRGREQHGEYKKPHATWPDRNVTSKLTYLTSFLSASV